MKLTILISTVEDGLERLRGKMASIPDHIDILICHQTKVDQEPHAALVQEIESSRPRIKVIRSLESGLARSRNCLLDQVAEGVCLISDDDVEYVEGFYERIAKAYSVCPDADIVTFQVKTPVGGFYKTYKAMTYKHNILTAGRVSSVEITFKAESLRRGRIRFDQRFGLGATYPAGEEYIFLADCIRNGLRAYYAPSAIVVHPEASSGKVMSDDNFMAKGAVFYRIFGGGSYFIMLFFAIRKRRYYISKYTALQIYVLLAKGARRFKEGVARDAGVLGC